MPFHLSPPLLSASIGPSIGQGKRSPYQSKPSSFGNRSPWICSRLTASYKSRFHKIRRCSSRVYPKSFRKRSHRPFRGDRAVQLLFAKILRSEPRGSSSRTGALRRGTSYSSLEAETESEEGEPPLWQISPFISSRLGYPQRSPPR